MSPETQQLIALVEEKLRQQTAELHMLEGMVKQIDVVRRNVLSSQRTLEILKEKGA